MLPALIRARLAQTGRGVLDLFTPEGRKAELTLVLVISLDGLLVRRQSPILVAT